VYEVTDKNLKDAFGYNAEIGFRGKEQSFRWDVTGFYLRYNNRLGTIAQTTTNGQLQVVRTNIGNSHNKGIELFVQKDFSIGNQSQLSIFNSTSYINANYFDATIRSNNLNININGNTVESVPKWISRNGVSYKTTLGSISILYSYTASSFADALNSITPNATASSGKVPSYQLIDLNLTIPISNTIKFQLNANNVFDKQYFTKRPQFYPGPGIWPSDGRTVSCSISLKFQ
jgi:Fe(3+) dicitrate transport protein